MRTRATALIIKDGSILMIHRFRDGEDYYVLPGGGVEEGEKPEEAVLREVKEETTLDVKLIKHLQTWRSKYREWDNEHQLFFCEYISGEPKLQSDSSEAKKTTEENTYKPVWVGIDKLDSLTIYPEHTKEVLADFLNK
jgi:8-oxo-dGTP diphosphatase